ncbi:unnamed protein product [Moneuplotes crassus]|uniref:Methyltransferase type 11 domain-containing protein n=1 Tax=Euplotes crassus TaxID=5936 RepID=A0AAD2D168_EUPCR|nr:unnamed protein product [Moneuplotes crassus]
MENNKEDIIKEPKDWDTFVEMYQDVLEHFAMQSPIILYSLTQAKKFSKICEVGVGPGLAARMFISNIMKKGAAYFCSDLSDEMIKGFYDNFQNCDSALNPRNKLEMIEDFETIDTNKHIKEMGDEIEKKLFLVKASNEKLPYPDECFDLYLSSLSLHIVDNYMVQLEEAYRILEIGGVAGFTIPGRKENCTIHHFVPDVLESLGYSIPPPSKKDPNHLSNKEALEKDFKKIGFSVVKTYYTQANFIMKNVTEMLNIIIKFKILSSVLSTLSPTQMQELTAELEKQWELKFGQGTTEVQELELLVVIATK